MKTKLAYLTTKLMVIVILIAVLAVKALAGDAPKVKLIPHTENRAIIAIDNSNNENAVLSIEDNNGFVVYYNEGNIDETIYSKVFDFKFLDEGQYKILVKNKFGETSLLFKKNSKGVTLAETKVGEKPYFKLENDILKFSMLNHSLNCVNFKLSNDEGKIFEKSLGTNFSITDGFNFEKLPEGEYSATISNGKNTFSYNFEK